MKIQISNLIIAAVLIFSLAACTAKTTETTSNQTETTERPERGNRPQNGERPQGKQGKQGKGKPQFADLLKEMDTNGDGLLSKSEVKGPLEKDFDSVDTDKDGFITEVEFKNMPTPQRGQR